MQSDQPVASLCSPGEHQVRGGVGKDKGGGEMWKRGRKGEKKEKGNGRRKGGMLPVIIEGRVDKKLVLCPIHLMFMFTF